MHYNKTILHIPASNLMSMLGLVQYKVFRFMYIEMGFSSLKLVSIYLPEHFIPFPPSSPLCGQCLDTDYGPVSIQHPNIDHIVGRREGMV